MWLVEKNGERCILADYELTYKTNGGTKFIMKITSINSHFFAGLSRTKHTNKVTNIIKWMETQEDKLRIKRENYLEAIRKLKAML